MGARVPPLCGHWIGTQRRHCGDDPIGRYLTGWRCLGHTPARVAGRAEPKPGPGYTPQATPSPLGDSALFDQRAIASGKRRSNPAEYRAAQTARKGAA